MRRWLPALVLIVVAGGGCSLVEPSNLAVAAPTVVCDGVQIDPPPELKCEAAVQATLAQTGLEGLVAMASFHIGSPCAPNMRCAFGVDQGYVVLRLVDGRCGYVHVALRPEEINPRRISVSTLEAWPPDEWQGMGVPAGVQCQ